jgi:hypothetical protein
MNGGLMNSTRTRLLVSLLVSSLLMIPDANGQELTNPLPDLRQQAVIQQEWLKERLEHVLPMLMREQGIAMWIVSMREYNEDPVFSSLVSATSFSARRRTIYVFFDRGEKEGVERIALGGGTQGGLYTSYRDTTRKADAELWGKGQWEVLRRIVEERNPRTIAVDISETHAFADGLSAGEWEQMQKALGTDYVARVRHADRLALDFVAIRVNAMVPTYKTLMASAHAIIGTAFSRAVITPGKTRTQDVVWWMRQKVQDLGLGTWFQPSVDVQRKGLELLEDSDPVIERGDVLHCDFGIVGMGLHTDTQHMAYVLRQGEEDVPDGIANALRQSNRLQDIVMEHMKTGLTGNEILRSSLEQMRQEGIDGSVYCHPVGQHGHGAGSLVGLWDRQEGVPGRGDVPVLPNTWYSIELQAASAVPEWGGQTLRCPLEEDAAIDSAGRIEWVLARQTKFHLIK